MADAARNQGDSMNTIRATPVAAAFLRSRHDPRYIRALAARLRR
jgi:hypothetical protein